MIKETFKVAEQKNGQYKVIYSSTESNVTPQKIMNMHNQLEKLVGQSKVNLQEFEPHIVEARREMILKNIELLGIRLKEITKTEGMPPEVIKELSGQTKKQIDQRGFELDMLKKDNLELRKEQIKKDIETKELRLKEIRPHISSIKIKIRKEQEKAKRLSKEMRKKLEKERKAEQEAKK